MPEACFRHGERELRLPSTLISISPEHFLAKRRSLTRFEAPPRSRHIAAIPPCAPSTPRVGGNLSAPQPFKEAKWRIAWPSAD